MRIAVSDPTLTLALRDHLRRARCIAFLAGPGLVEVVEPETPSEAQARRELRAYLAAWLALHPRVKVEVVDGD